MKMEAFVEKEKQAQETLLVTARQYLRICWRVRGTELGLSCIL